MLAAETPCNNCCHSWWWEYFAVLHFKVSELPKRMMNNICMWWFQQVKVRNFWWNQAVLVQKWNSARKATTSLTYSEELPKAETIRIQKTQSALVCSICIYFAYLLCISILNSYRVIQLFLILIYLSRLGKLRLGKRHTFELLHRQQVTCKWHDTSESSWRTSQ